MKYCDTTTTENFSKLLKNKFRSLVCINLWLTKWITTIPNMSWIENFVKITWNLHKVTVELCGLTRKISFTIGKIFFTARRWYLQCRLNALQIPESCTRSSIWHNGIPRQHSALQVFSAQMGQWEHSLAYESRCHIICDIFCHRSNLAQPSTNSDFSAQRSSNESMIHQTCKVAIT